MGGKAKIDLISIQTASVCGRWYHQHILEYINVPVCFV